MSLRNVKTISWGLATAALFGLAASLLSGAAAPNTAPNVTFTCSGTFANPPISGADTLRLAGEPFTIQIVANAASVPISHGPNWAVLSPFKMTGVVHSGLLGPTPVNIASGAASILQLIAPTYDLFQTAFPVKVVGISLTINAQIAMPPGTIPNSLIHIFSPVTISPSNGSVTYASGGASTVLAISSGTLTATVPTPK